MSDSTSLRRSGRTDCDTASAILTSLSLTRWSWKTCVTAALRAYFSTTSMSDRSPVSLATCKSTWKGLDA
ncbi:hypothetical protein [Actinomadura rubrisoli]|uniref:hypothetical protein n=1 Tax=Actinomadura rubrisoli TaxID=2530368 RepID=UPI001FB5825E|nr:hypothetical protein [Actinomadura rubrisoli]